MLGALVVIAPSSGGITEPISFALARGEQIAHLGMKLLLLTLAYFAYRLARFRVVWGALACVAVMVGLLYIVNSDPYSSDHLMVFVCIAVFAVFVQWAMAITQESCALHLLAAVGTIGLGVCLGQLGTGERMLIVSSVAAINIVFYATMVD